MSPADTPTSPVDSPRPRTAYYERAGESPSLPRAVWWRVVRLFQARGVLASAPALRMAQHLTWRADRAGRLADVAAAVRLYAVEHAVSVRTGWTDLGRLVDAGLVGQTAAAAPGRAARYVLTVPAELLPDDLPGELAEELTAVLRPVAELAEGLAEVETVRVGSVTAAEPRECVVGCGSLHTSPTYARRSPPRSPRRPRNRTDRPHPAGRSGDKRSNEDREAAAVVQACRSSWVDQRGAAGDPGADDLAVMWQAVSGALSAGVASGDLVEALTDRVGTASDLVAVLVWRCRRLARAARPARRVPADEAGQRAADHAARRDQARTASAAGRATYRAAAAAVRARRPAVGPVRPRRGPHPATGPARQPPRPVAGLWEIEQAIAAATPGLTPPRTPPASTHPTPIHFV